MCTYTGERGVLVRKKWIVLMVCILISCMILPVCAAEKVTDRAEDSLLAGYILDDKLYAFFEAGEPVETALFIGGVACAEAYTEALVESDQYVHYYILLDASGSVEKSRGRIREFVMKLMEKTDAKQLFTIMTLGDSFHPVIEGSLEDDAVEKALDGIAYRDARTNLYKGIDSAVRYIDEKEKTRGDLCRLILVTDGKPDGETDKPSPAEVKKQIESRTDIVFDVIGVGQWKEGSEKDLPMSGRDAAVVENSRQASDAAAKLAAETNNLYTVCFELEKPVQDHSPNIEIFLKGSERRTLKQQNITVIGKEAVSDATEESEEASETDNTKEEQESTADTEEEQETTTTDVKEEQETTTADVKEEQETTTADAMKEQESETDMAMAENAIEQRMIKKLPVYGGVALGVVVLCVAAIILLRKLLRKDSRIAPNHLRVEVISGKYASKKKDFPLEHMLIIGSEKTCDIIWKEPDVAARNTRIFIHEGIVCIEDLNSPCGTTIGGMRIFAPNRLRSGDIVSIGDHVRFRIFFNLMQ